MADLVVSMAIGPLVSMLKDKASNYLLDQYNVMEGMEEQHKILKRKLPAILDIITYAEEQATAHMEGAKAWLQELRTLAYEANEVFDEFKYEALRREAKKNGHYRKLKLFPTHNRVEFRRRMGSKLCRILRDIEALIADMQAFGFKYQPQPQPPVSKQWRQTDYVIIDPQEIARRSRYKEKKNIVDILLGQASNADLAVVPIVGMGGLGKTTLAQLIYNEPEIQKHFQLLLWVCVSDTFDVNSLAKSIVEASPKKNHDTDKPPKPPLDRLQNLVSGQRYLLVLDDVWNNREFHKWERLKVCLQHGGSGSAVLATTRDKRVAEIMSAHRAYHLNDLDDRFLKEIIEAKAFGSEKEKPAELVEMVDDIVKRCSGSPLAATALGSVLRTKLSVKEWKAVSSRTSICTDETRILPILKLSYNDLASHMKQCFAFCAVFPKDYKIDVDKLIQLWIANGFIPEHKEDSLETIGKYIFDELASRSFFLDIEESKDDLGYCSTTCKIHDLMHDIAMSVMEKECVVETEKPSQIEWFPDTTRHLFLSCEGIEGVLNDCMEKRSPTIQTLLCDRYVGCPLQHLSKYNSLHAMKLRKSTESFLLKPKHLHHLRYLDISKSYYIKALPEDISVLYNLQMLDVSYCGWLVRLPKMKYMTSIRHLYTHGCSELKSVPSELGKLTKLQTLTCFVAAATGPDSSDVAELQHLNIGGQLELCQVENVIEAEAKVANLGNKKDLRELTLRWSYVCGSEVLSNFEPHDRLQVLKIYSYGGKCMGMLQNMVEIHLVNCVRLQVLFRCGTSFSFPKLKHLTLEHLLDFERWWEINEMQEGKIIFPVLEKLVIRDCGNLKALPEATLLQKPCSGRYHSAFPAIKVLGMVGLETFQIRDAIIEGKETLFPLEEELSIEKCPKLIALPKAPLVQEPYSESYRSAFPALKVLRLEKLESFQRWDAAVEGDEILFPQLEELSIGKCAKLIALPEAPLIQEPCKGGYRSSFPALKVLKMNELESFQRWDATIQREEILFPLLEELSIEKCPKLIDLPEAPKLSVLKITDGKQEIFHWVDRYLSSLTNLILELENTETTSETEYALVEQVDIKEKWNKKSPITVMNLGCCNSFFGSGALDTWDCFVHLQVLEIGTCDVLIHWPEKVFQSLVYLRTLLFVKCNNLTGYGQAPLEPSASKWSQHLPALEALGLFDCASLVEMFNIPPSLKRMIILRCHKLEFIFGKQQLGISGLFQGSSRSEAIINTVVSQLSSSPMNHFCPCLEFLWLGQCDSLSAVLHLPPSLKTIYIDRCSSIQVMSSQLEELSKPHVTTSINVPEPSAAAAREHSLPPCLESLTIRSCTAMLGGILHPPTSLKSLSIDHNNGFTSLEPLSGESPSLQSLSLKFCSTLASLPSEPQAYRSLQDLTITCCPAIKKLPRCLQQQLGSLNYKDLDAQYEVMAFEPKTWKEIPRLVRERRQAGKADGRAEEAG